jgi:hypothetical protein
VERGGGLKETLIFFCHFWLLFSLPPFASILDRENAIFTHQKKLTQQQQQIKDIYLSIFYPPHVLIG